MKTSQHMYAARQQKFAISHDCFLEQGQRFAIFIGEEEKKSITEPQHMAKAMSNTFYSHSMI
jgi:hypothetical protein